MKRIMTDMANAISDKITKIVKDKAISTLTYSKDMEAFIAFYCAAQLIGEDIIIMENETIEYALLEKKVDSKIVRKVIMVKSLVGDLDSVFTVPESFSVAIDVLNDNDVDTNIIDYRRPEKVIWALVLLMSLSGAENIPVSGGAAGYVVACLKTEGWTMPPLMLNVQKFTDLFEYYNKDIYNGMGCTQKNMLISCTISSGGEVSSSQENFMELHKPIIHYIMSKAQDMNESIAKVSA